VKEGADQFLAKPVELPALLAMLKRLLESQREKRRQIAGRARQAREAVDPFTGSSATNGASPATTSTPSWRSWHSTPSRMTGTIRHRTSGLEYQASAPALGHLQSALALLVSVARPRSRCLIAPLPSLQPCELGKGDGDQAWRTTSRLVDQHFGETLLVAASAT
jgi:hypothetical protein